MKLFWILVFLSLQLSVQAQDSLSAENSSNQRDINDLFSLRLRPRRKPVELTWIPTVGYSLQTGFAGVIGANIAFRTLDGDDSKLSSVTASLTYSQYNQTIFPLMSNIWSKNGKWNYSTDWRFMQYPSETWGLAGRKDPTDGYTINFSYLKLHQMVLRSITKSLFVGTGVFYDRIWNIREVSAPADGSTSFQRYGLSKDEIAIALPVRLLFDSRLNQINPSQGWYISLTLRDNLKSLGSKQNWGSVVLDIRKYIRVSESGNTLAFWLYSWQSSARTPYLLLPSTGWDDSFNTGRGYIQGRFRSNIMEYLEMEYRFKLTQNGLLGGVAFANAQAFKRRLTTGPYVMEPAVGAGLRLKLNKHSGANLCIDYGIGQSGSRGFFVNLGEVF